MPWPYLLCAYDDATTPSSQITINDFMIGKNLRFLKNEQTSVRVTITPPSLSIFVFFLSKPFPSKRTLSSTTDRLTQSMFLPKQ